MCVKGEPHQFYTSKSVYRCWVVLPLGFDNAWNKKKKKRQHLCTAFDPF